MRYPFLALFALIAGSSLVRAIEPHLPSGTRPLSSSAEKGRGPLALVNLNHHVLGYASVFGGERPDLFVAGYGGPQAVHLFRWVDTTKDQAPVFAQPVQIQCAFKDKGCVYQRKDGRIFGLWIDGKELVTTAFNLLSLAFTEIHRVPLPAEVSAPSSLGVFVNSDETLDLAFEVSGEGKGPEGHPWTEEWRPFNSSGIASGQPRYRYLMGITADGKVTQITPSKREVYFSMHNVTPMNLGKGHERDVVTGSRQGNLVHYHNLASQGFALEPKRLIADEDGIAIRHPSINPSVTGYPGGLIACGEGALYYYRFTGLWTKSGAPIFAKPVPVLQEKADLYAGTLPTPTTVDWNGDGNLDVLVGNSEGFILFFENIGSNEQPKFLPATRVQAGGRDIQVQAGYAGSLQGLQESRWGYVSPNVIDWNGDALPDILTGDITGNYQVYLNRGRPTQPLLEPAHPLYCDGIDLHGMWRCRPAVAEIDGDMVIVIVDGEDHFHLYRQIDEYNVEDAGKLKMHDGKPIGASGGVGGMSGRCKLDLFDWNRDGHLDFVIGTGRVNAIPDRETGLPMPTIGKKTLGTPLLMLNLGTNQDMKFARPVPFLDRDGKIIQPGGAHETGAVGTMLGGHGPNLLICNEAGRLFLITRDQLQPEPLR